MLSQQLGIHSKFIVISNSLFTAIFEKKNCKYDLENNLLSLKITKIMIVTMIIIIVT